MTLLGGKAGPCAIYPEELCTEICIGLKEQIEQDRMSAWMLCKMMNDKELCAMDTLDEIYWDDSKAVIFHLHSFHLL